MSSKRLTVGSAAVGDLFLVEELPGEVFCKLAEHAGRKTILCKVLRTELRWGVHAIFMERYPERMIAANVFAYRVPFETIFPPGTSCQFMVRMGDAFAPVRMKESDRMHTNGTGGSLLAYA